MDYTKEVLGALTVESLFLNQAIPDTQLGDSRRAMHELANQTCADLAKLILNEDIIVVADPNRSEWVSHTNTQEPGGRSRLHQMIDCFYTLKKIIDTCQNSDIGWIRLAVVDYLNLLWDRIEHNEELLVNIGTLLSLRLWLNALITQYYMLITIQCD